MYTDGKNYVSQFTMKFLNLLWKMINTIDELLADNSH